MYKRDISHTPSPISRPDFINLLFDLGETFDFPCYIMSTSLHLSDSFVSSFPSVYSVELAHSSLVLISKCYCDDYYLSSEANMSVSNKFIFQLEWDLARFSNWSFPLYDPLLLSSFSSLCPSPFFTELYRQISLFSIPLSPPRPLALYTAILLLHKFNRLSASSVLSSRKLLYLIDYVSEITTTT